MVTLTVTEKGQVTLRKDLLSHLGVHPGERIELEKHPGGAVVVTAMRRTGRLSDVFDLLKRDGGARLSIDEIDEAAAQGWAGMR